jgi:hypothetical protein
VRKAQYPHNPEVNPEKEGMRARDPTANVSPAEHALNEHQGGRTPWLSASDTPLGDPKYEGTRYWISKWIAEKTGTEVKSNDQILADADRMSSERQNPGFDARIEKYFKPDQAKIKEVLFRGYIAPSAIESGWTRGLKGVGTGLMLYGVYKTSYNMTTATIQSIEQGTPAPVVKQGLRETGGWAAGWAGAQVGFEIGAAFGIETGPGAVLTGLAGGAVGGTLGYRGVDLTIAKYEQIDLHRFGEHYMTWQFSPSFYMPDW